MIGEIFHLEECQQQSLNAVAKGDLQPQEATLKIDNNLSVLQLIKTEAGIFTSQLNELFKSLKQEYDYILFDTPTGKDMAEVYSLSECVDAAILVIEHMGITVKESEEIVHRFQQLSLPILGAVFTKVRMRKG